MKLGLVLDGGAALCAAKRFVYTPSAKATMWLWRLLCNRGQYIRHRGSIFRRNFIRLNGIPIWGYVLIS